MIFAIGGKENLIISEKDKHLMTFEEYKRVVNYQR